MTQPVLMAPGVYFTETDISQYIRILSSALLGVVTTATTGPVNTETLVTTTSELINTFGIPDENHPGLGVAYEFLNAGGSICYVVRVTNGSDVAAAVTLNNIDGSTTETLTAAFTGSYYNNMKAIISYNGEQPTSVSASKTLTASTLSTETLPNAPVVPNTVQVTWNGVVVASDNGAGGLVFTSGALTGSTGTVNYNTGVVDITPPSGFTTASHTLSVAASYFSLFNIQLEVSITDDDDEVVSSQIVESFLGLNLSNYVSLTANAQNIVPPEAAPSTFPISGTFDFSGGDDGISDIDDTEFIGNVVSNVPTGLQIFAYPDLIDINLVCIPGRSSTAISQALIQLASTQRADTLAILDPPSDVSTTAVAQWANAQGSYSSNQVINSNYAAIYYPYYNRDNTILGTTDLVPPSTAAVQAFARSQPYQAPAGPNRGLINNFAGISVLLSPGDRVFLGQNRINPLANLGGLGTQVAGQYTATLEASSLDRVAARMMLLTIEKAVTTSMFTFLFEPNTATTWAQVENLVQPYLNSLVNAGQIYAGQIYCDSVTNTALNVNNNIMVAYVVLQLLKYAEIIVVNFELTAFGTTITESLINQANSNAPI